MKKLLLTLLGAAALCGLSPHRAQAAAPEIIKMDLQKRVTGDPAHNTDLTFTKGETTTEWPTTNVTSPSANYGGFDKVENDDFIIGFYYFDPIAGSTATAEKKSHYTTGTFQSSYKLSEGITVYGGTRITINIKDGNKRIVALKIKTGIVNTSLTDVHIVNLHPIISLKDGGDDNSVTISRSDYAVTTKKCSAITLGNPKGFENGVIIELPRTNCKNIFNANGGFCSTSTFSNKEAALAISEIEAEVINVSDIPKLGTIYGYTSSVEAWNTTSSQWETPDSSAYYNKIVKFRLNDKVIVEFTRYNSATAGTPTVTYDATNHTLGAHKGDSIRAYPDQSLTYKDKPSTTYAVEYRLNNPFKSDVYSPAYCSSYNLTPNSSITSSGSYLYTKYIKKYNDGTKLSTTAVNLILAATENQAAIKKSKSIAILSKASGLVDTTTVTIPVLKSGYKYLNPTTVTGTNAPSNDTKVANGALPAFIFDEVDLTISTEETTGSRSPVATVSAADGDVAVIQADGGRLFKNSIKVNATLDDDRFPEAKLYYMTEGTAFDKSKATQVPEDGVITINASCDLKVYAVVTIDGKEIASDPASVKLNKLQVKEVANYADLLKEENNGQPVMIKFTTRTRFNGRLQRTTTMPRYPFAFIYDNDGNPIKISSNYSSTTQDLLTTGAVTTGTKRETTLFVAPSATLDDDKFIEAGSIIGLCRITDGHPEIILADEISDDKFDYRDFCATKPKTSAEISMTEEQKKAADEAFAKVYESEELSQEHWGKFVRISNLMKYDKTDSTFVDKLGEGKKVKMMYTSSNVSNVYPLIYGSSSQYYPAKYANYVTALPSGNDSTKVTLGGLVDFQHNTARMVIHANEVYFNLSKPVFTAASSNGLTITEREQSDADADQTFDIECKKALNSHGFNLTLINGKGQPTKAQLDKILCKFNLEYFDLNNEGEKIATVSSGKIDDNGRSLVKVIATIVKSNLNGTVLQPELKDSATIAIYDPVKSAPQFTFISDIDRLTADDIARNPYIYLKRIDIINNTYPTPVVRYPTMMAYKYLGEYNLVREVRRDTATVDNDIIADTDYPRWYILKSTDMKYSKYYTKDDLNSRWSTKDHARIDAGDGIEEFIAKAEINEQGNVILDISGTQTAFHCYRKCINVNDNKKAAFETEYEDYSAPIEFDDASKASIGLKYLNKIVSIPELAIKNENGAYIAGIPSSNVITWNMLCADKKEAQTAMIDNGKEGAHYSLTALVLNDGNGGYALEVIELKAGFAKTVKVCEHPDHDSYYKNQNFDGVADGEPVEMLGAKLKIDESGNVTAELASTVTFLWSTHPENEETQKNLVKDTRATTTRTFNVTGKLSHNTDGTTTIDVEEFEAIDSYPSFDDYQHKFVFNGQSWVTWGSIQADFPYYTTAEMRGPKYLKGYYRHADTEEGLADAPAIEFDSTRTVKFSDSGWYTFFTCNPGKRGLYPCDPRKFTKTAPFSESVGDVLQQESPNGYYHFTGSLMIASVTSHDATVPDIDENHQEYDRTFTQYVGMATDNEGRHIRVIFPESFIPEAGMYITDFLLRQQNYAGSITGTMYESLNEQVNLMLTNYTSGTIVTPEPGKEITMPEAELRASISAADNGRLIRLSDMRIGGNETDGFTITPAGSTEAIRVNNALFWNPGEDVDPDMDYCIEGYVMPVKSAAAGTAVKAKARAAAFSAEDGLEFWPAVSEAKRPTDTPALTVTGYESEDEGSYVTVAPVTVKAAIEGRDSGSPMEYSTDGGANWKAFGNDLTIDESANLWVRAQKPGYLPSEPAKIDIRREYYSAEAKITPTAKGGYTEVVIVPATDLEADSYKIYYTTDGTEPTAESALYTAPIESEKAASIRALVVENGKRPGKATEPVAVSVRAHDLDITPEKGEGFTTVTIAPKDPKHLHQSAEIRYTTDGSEPTAGSALYTAPFEVEAAHNGMTVKAICIEPDKTAGQVAASTIAVEGLRPSCDVAITLTENSGTYYITLTAEAGDIWYRIGDTGDFVKYDGTPVEYTPTANGTYTVSAYALEEGKKAGKTATENIVVTGISGIGADGEADGVRVEGNTITVPEGAQTFDIAGRRVNPQGLSRGIYIVRLASGKAVKVVIR